MSLPCFINGSLQSCLAFSSELKNVKGTDLFEIHVTVAPLFGSEVQAFQVTCRQHGLKAIMIEFGVDPTQPMTCSRHWGDLQGAHDETDRIKTVLESHCFRVERVKIEAAPTNSCVPQTDVDARHAPDGCYFEHHLKLRLEQTDSGCELNAVCLRFGGHLSRNAFKKLEDGTREQFVTLRAHGVGLRTTQERVAELTVALKHSGYLLIASVSEYCVFDSNLDLDTAWVRP